MKKIFMIIITALCFTLSIITIFYIYKLGILPTSIFSIITIIFIGLLISIVLLNTRKKKIFKILGIVLSILFIIINCVGTYFVYNTYSFFNKSFNGKGIEKTTYYVVALKSKSYTEDNIKGDISYYVNIPNKDKLFKLLKSNYELKFNSCESINDMYTDLLEEKTNLVLTEAISYNIVRKLNSDIEDNFEVIKEFTISEEIKSNEVKDEAFNIYIVGNDFAGCNDFNMIVTVNTTKKKVLLTSIPRDYHIEVAGMDGVYDNITYMSTLGIDTSIKSLEKLFNTTIDYYVKINTSSLVKLVDSIGGIEFCSDYEYTTTHALVIDTYNDSLGKKLYVRKGCQHLNGIETLTVARERIKIPGSDIARQDNCRKIMLAIFNKLKSVNSITNYNNLLDNLAASYETNIPINIIQTIGTDTLKSGSKWEILEQAVVGSDVIGYVHLNTVRDYTMLPDYASVDAAIKKIDELGK